MIPFETFTDEQLATADGILLHDREYCEFIAIKGRPARVRLAPQPADLIKALTLDVASFSVHEIDLFKERYAKGRELVCYGPRLTSED